MSSVSRAIAVGLGLLAGCRPADGGPEPAAVPTEVEAAPTLAPFEDVPSTRPGSSAGGQPNASFADSGLGDSAVWKRAVLAAEEAEELYQAAAQAHRDGERSLLNSRGAEAKALFNRALEDTAEFEAEIVETYGERDSGVAAIMAVRNRWFDRLRWLHKTVGAERSALVPVGLQHERARSPPRAGRAAAAR